MEEKFQHKKSLGQHFLNSAYVPKKMCDAARLTVGETVLEIGPGTGALTKELLERGVTVIALEADSRAIERLTVTFSKEIASGQLIIHHHDVRTLIPETFGLTAGKYKVVANIPYYLSGFLFRTLLEAAHPPNTLVFLVQKEVARRIAKEKKESLLSISVKIFGTPSYICTVGRNHFTPPPAVDSAIVAIYDISHRHFTDISIPAFFELLHLGFGQKRKQLLSNLSKVYARPALEQIFSAISLSPQIRAEDVPLPAWLQLAKALQSTE
ncbi:MAG TPA: 16S rRNA (adenine(1518)-N(6)/adenine(1519)-N(6))-dimethyltransferase RsmA [Candidatus Paceibacterota bacterium]